MVQEPHPNRLRRLENSVEYFALTFVVPVVGLAAITPMPLIINALSVGLCIFKAQPSIMEVAKLHPTVLLPNGPLVIGFFGVTCLLQVGYYVWALVLSGGSGWDMVTVAALNIFLAIANIGMGICVVLWVYEWLLSAALAQGIVLIALIIPNIVLFLRYPRSKSFTEEALVYAPFRFCLVLSFNLLFMITFMTAASIDFEPIHQSLTAPIQASRGLFCASLFALINLVELVAVFVDGDVPMCIAAMVTAASIWTATPNPPPVHLTAIACTALHPLILAASFVQDWYSSKYPPVQLPS